ncbi:MAG: family 20 glycosylhydrolase [Flavobacteriales bacterium]|nr:family 20 glycosylhydrolase [Flavobacteriales bacterium]
MRSYFFPFLFLSYSLHGQTVERPSIIPAPVQIEVVPGECRLDRAWKLKGSTKDEMALVQVLGPELSALRPSTLIDPGEPLQIFFRTVASDTIVPTGYHTIQVSPEGMIITSPTAEGLFLGSRTILQLLGSSGEQPSVPYMKIVDYPRFGWRGMHLDVCRHFFDVAFVKKYIDLLARYKMNSFHWHLTDDQGWRIEIKKYPKLTKVGGWRSGSQVGPYSMNEFDQVRYGGSYTQEEIREVVAYASARHINVVPEIEMPGHALAALAAYPELGCTGGPYKVERGWGVFPDVFCPTDSTIHFLEHVLAEVIDLFPSTIIHIGGDECPKESWKACAKCQARMKAEGLKDEHELQSYFIQRIEKFVNSKGRTIIGWDEILEGGLAPNASVMSWRGTEGGVAAAKSGHDAVMSPGSHCYFDHYQGDPANEPLSIGGYTTLQKVYSYEPIPAELNAEEAKHILGAQGNIWTEYILTSDHVEYMALPRMAALAEVLWSPREKRDEADLLRRLEQEFTRLDVMNVNYAKSLYQVSITPRSGAKPGEIMVELSGSLTGTKIQKGVQAYPTEAEGTSMKKAGAVSDQYDGPFMIDGPCVVTAGYISADPTRANAFPRSSRSFRFQNATARPITLSEPPAEQYNYGGAFTLVDGISARGNRVNTEWLGWRSGVSATVDLGSETAISHISIGAMNDTYSWIHLPKLVEIAVSKDGATDAPLALLDHGTVDGIRTVFGTDTDANARYVRFTIKHIGNIPDGFPGAGNPAWLFLDEIDVH